MLTTHRHDRRGRRQAGLLLESLDDRLLLSGGAGRDGRGCSALSTGQPRAPLPPYQPARGSRGPIARCAAGQRVLQHSGCSTASTRTKAATAASARLPARSALDPRLQSRRANQGGVPPRLGCVPRRSPGGRAANHSHRAGLRDGRRHAAGRQVAGRSAARGARVARSPVPCDRSLASRGNHIRSPPPIAAHSSRSPSVPAARRVTPLSSPTRGYAASSKQRSEDRRLDAEEQDDLDVRRQRPGRDGHEAEADTYSENG